MSDPSAQSQTKIANLMKARTRWIWQPTVSWLDQLFKLARDSKAFQFATFLYILISLLQAGLQAFYAPTTQSAMLSFPNENFALCVRYPTHLTFDGDTRQGRLSLQLIPNMEEEVCLDSYIGWTEWFATQWWGVPFMLLTRPSGSANPTTPPTPAAFFVTTTNTAPLVSTGVTPSVQSATQTVTISIPTSNTLAATQGVGMNLATNTSTLTPTLFLTQTYTFALIGSPDLLFVNAAEEAYSPVISLTIGSETSVMVAHARLNAGNSESSFTVKYLASGMQSMISPVIDLEAHHMLWWRKFFEILLAPTTGALLALIAVGLEEMRKREVEQKEKEEAQRLREIQRTCQQTLSKFENLYSEDLLLVIQTWLEWVDQIPEDLADHTESSEFLSNVYIMAVEKFIDYAKTHIDQFKDSESRTNKLQNRLVELCGKLQIDEELENRFNDLVFISTYLKNSTKVTDHKFVTAELAGSWANLEWSKDENRVRVSTELQRLLQNAKQENNLAIELLAGAFNCEQSFKTMPLQISTLLREVANDYATQSLTEFDKYQERYPWWQGMIAAIEQFSQPLSQPQSQLYEWWREIKQKKEKREELKRLKQHIETGIPFIRFLWPLQPTGNDRQTPKYDANYDFPGSLDVVESLGAEAKDYSLLAKIGSVQKDDLIDKQIAAIEICQNYLSLPNHHVVTGAERAGKTWLRLYLEYYTFVVGAALPVFYFAPASMAYETDEVESVTYLVRSIANQLFASLLERSNYRTTDSDPFRARRGAIIPFLQRYDYNIPTGDASLAQPVPTERLLDIDLAYKNMYGVPYVQMKRQIESISTSAYASSPATVEQMLTHTQYAIDLADYKSIFVLIDNWDNLPEPSVHRLLHYLLNENLLLQLQKRNIFLKVFVPTIDLALQKHLSGVCELERTYNGTKRKLSLYKYP